VIHELLQELLEQRLGDDGRQAEGGIGLGGGGGGGQQKQKREKTATHAE
jgi:hypothetical protein